MKTGDEARISAVSGGQGFQERLCELGLSKGAKVQVKAYLPFNGPVVMRVESTTLALRREEAHLLEVES